MCWNVKYINRGSERRPDGTVQTIPMQSKHRSLRIQRRFHTSRELGWHAVSTKGLSVTSHTALSYSATPPTPIKRCGFSHFRGQYRFSGHVSDCDTATTRVRLSHYPCDPKEWNHDMEQPGSDSGRHQHQPRALAIPMTVITAPLPGWAISGGDDIDFRLPSLQSDGEQNNPN